MDYTSHIILPKHGTVFKSLDKLASGARVVCFSGLPAVGKSMYIQQFSYLALSKGREITTLQWDRARQAFETGPLLSKYPESDGITHPCIRKGCGQWARKAVYTWSIKNTDPRSLLIIEAPLIGNRLVELAVPANDECEDFLRMPEVQFVLPVPTAEIRTAIEARRRKTSTDPKHEQERADANPFVVAVLSKELSEVAVRLGYRGPSEWHVYNPSLYEYVYRAVLKYRNLQVLKIDFLVDVPDSVYAFAGPDKKYLVPGDQELIDSIKLVESLYTSAGSLQTSVDNWYLIP